MCTMEKSVAAVSIAMNSLASMLFASVAGSRSRSFRIGCLMMLHLIDGEPRWIVKLHARLTRLECVSEDEADDVEEEQSMVIQRYHWDLGIWMRYCRLIYATVECMCGCTLRNDKRNDNEHNKGESDLR